MEKKSLNASQKMKKTRIGEIPVDWEILSLSKIANITTGKKDVNEGNTNGIYPFFTCSQKEYRIDEYSFDTEAVIVAGNAYFNVKYYIGKFDAYQRTYVIDGFKNNLAKYVFYVLSKDLKRLTTNNQGSAVKYIKLKDLTDFQFPLPPINERQKIIDVLTTIDSVIEKTQSVIDQTQILKKGLMQELFTRGIPGRHKKFRKTEIGEIPEEWEVIKLGELSIDGINNGIFKKKHQYGRGVLLVNVFDTYGSLCVNPSTLDRVEASKEEIIKFGLIKGDLLFVRSSLKYEGVGQCCMVKLFNEPMVYECHLMRVRPNPKKVVPLYLVYYCNSTKFRSDLFSNAKIQTMTTLAQSDIASLYVPLPTIEEQIKISSALENCDIKVNENNILKENLQNLKSALMQVLLTGKVRVK